MVNTIIVTFTAKIEIKQKPKNNSRFIVNKMIAFCFEVKSTNRIQLNTLINIKSIKSNPVSFNLNPPSV